MMSIRIFGRPKKHQYLQGNECVFTFVIKKGYNQRQHPCTKLKVFCLLALFNGSHTADDNTELNNKLCNGKERHSKLVQGHHGKRKHGQTECETLCTGPLPSLLTSYVRRCARIFCDAIFSIAPNSDKQAVC